LAKNNKIFLINLAFNGIRNTPRVGPFVGKNFSWCKDVEDGETRPENGLKILVKQRIGIVRDTSKN